MNSLSAFELIRIIARNHKLPHSSEFESLHNHSFNLQRREPASERIRISRSIELVRISNSNYASRIVEEAVNVHCSFLSRKYDAYTA